MHAPFFLVTTAWNSILRHKGRSLLTVLSIIVGIATVIATLAIGRGAQEKIKRRITRMGSNTLVVRTGNFMQNGATTLKKKKRTQWLTQDDAAFITRTYSEVIASSGFCTYFDKLCTTGTQKISTNVSCCEAPHLRASKRTIAYGRNFLPHDISQSQRVVILGSDAACNLFKATPPLGKTVHIDNHAFTVIGVLEPVDNLNAFRNRNMELFIPLTSGRRILGHLPGRCVHDISVQLRNDADTAAVERHIVRAMRARHNLERGAPDDFMVINQAKMSQAAEESSQTFNLFLLIVASLSLLVGGIGVSNIMLVSVTERTKEIGIRMALGASPTMVLVQFLIEAVMLCSLGGILGTLIGITVPHIVAYFTDWLVIVTPLSVVISVLVTMLLGLLFGFLPARKASRLNVVEALHDQ